MPELPEVETVVRGLEKAIKGATIKTIETRRGNLRTPFPKNLKDAEGAKISVLSRRAKYIVMELSGGNALLLHLGMSGRLVIFGKGDKTPLEKHDHVIFHLSTGQRVVFNDARRFGILAMTPSKDIAAHKFFSHLGPEPFDPAFHAKYLTDKMKGRKAAIKLCIMDQRIVVGVGNIYASEALFMAKIDPRRASGGIKPAEMAALVKSIRAVLKKAIAAGGSSLRDYVQADGELGYFQHKWAVYGRKGEACRACKAKIEQITQGARSTFYCPRCQK